MNDFNTNFSALILKKALLHLWTEEKYSYKNNARPDYGFLYLSKGRVTYTFDDSMIELSSGDVIYLPKNCNYEVAFDLKNGAVETLLINFDVADNASFSDIKTPLCVIKNSPLPLKMSFKNTIDAYKNKSNPFYAYSLFYLCLGTIFETMQKENESKETLLMRQAAKLLEENSDMTIDKICNELYMSRSSFQKRFKEVYSISPVEYRTEKRLEKAKIMLETTDVPIKEIAEELGFYDTAYFYKTFEQSEHITPKQYREKRTLYF